MIIERYESNLFFSNMYMIKQGNHMIIIDPFQIHFDVGSFDVDKIILTHEHYDHISGVNYWKSMCDAPVLCSRVCSERIHNPSTNIAKYFKEFCQLQTWVKLDSIPDSNPDYICYADETFEDEHIFEWEAHTFKLFEMPGHSLGSIGILLDDSHFFSGDSLLENMEIELRVPGGRKKKWKEIGEPRLKSIPNGVIVHPGHFKEFKYIQKI